MSTFSGKIEEIPIISVDRFDENNYASDAYFLSHCHIDHMEGLNNSTFQNLLNNKNDVYLYTSPVSAEILKVLRPEIISKLKPLVLEIPTLVPLLNKKFLSVTLIRAGHCLGSVMFLFEYGENRILYTGDYRIHKNDFAKFKAFSYSSGALKRIDKIYLDTTFFYKNFPSFPPRDACVKEVCDIIRKWITQSENHLIRLNTSARIGYEYLLIEISKELGLPIHVNEIEYKFYRCIPEMDKAITLSSNSTPLHNNCGINFGSICQLHYPNCYIKSIRFSAMTWTENRLLNNESGVEDANDDTKVCYSTHASLEEGQALIRTLKPEAVEPCVVPKETTKYKEMMELIEDVIKEYKEICTESDYKTEDKLFVFKEEGIDVNHQNSNSTEKLCSLLESPPRKRMKKRTCKN